MDINPARIAVICLLLSWPLLLLAGDTPAIEFEADSIHYDNNTGSSTYRGNVRVVSGDMLLRGDEVEVLSGRDGILRIVSTASPSILQRRSPDGDFIAEARRIEYDVPKRRIVLTGDVRIRDGKKDLRGGRIIYDLEKEMVNAVKGKRRVRLRIGS